MFELDLKPCPFCGGTEIYPSSFDCEDREGWPTHFSCSDCGTNGPWCYTKDQNLPSKKLCGLWNKRV